MKTDVYPLSPHSNTIDLLPPPPSPSDHTRLFLAIIVAIAVITLSMVAVVRPAAEPILDKLLPLLTLVLGYFFGQQG